MRIAVLTLLASLVGGAGTFAAMFAGFEARFEGSYEAGLGFFPDHEGPLVGFADPGTSIEGRIGFNVRPADDYFGLVGGGGPNLAEYYFNSGLTDFLIEFQVAGRSYSYDSLGSGCCGGILLLGNRGAEDYVDLFGEIDAPTGDFSDLSYMQAGVYLSGTPASLFDAGGLVPEEPPTEFGAPGDVVFLLGGADQAGADVFVGYRITNFVVVPEPSTFALAVLAFALGITRRRRL